LTGQGRLLAAFVFITHRKDAKNDKNKQHYFFGAKRHYFFLCVFAVKN